MEGAEWLSLRKMANRSGDRTIHFRKPEESEKYLV